MAFSNLHSLRAPPYPLDVCQTRSLPLSSRSRSSSQVSVVEMLGVCSSCLSVHCPGGSYLSRTVSLTVNSPTGPDEQPGSFQFTDYAIYSRAASNFQSPMGPRNSSPSGFQSQMMKRHLLGGTTKTRSPDIEARAPAMCRCSPLGDTGCGRERAKARQKWSVKMAQAENKKEGKTKRKRRKKRWFLLA